MLDVFLEVRGSPFKTKSLSGWNCANNSGVD